MFSIKFYSFKSAESSFLLSKYKVNIKRGNPAKDLVNYSPIQRVYGTHLLVTSCLGLSNLHGLIVLPDDLGDLGLGDSDRLHVEARGDSCQVLL